MPDPSQTQGREAARSQSTRVRKTQTEAAYRIFDLAGERQGWRHTVLGSTGSGKTYWLRYLAKLAASHSDVVLIHDVKDRTPQYEGDYYDRIGDVVQRPPTGNTLVFRHGDPERVAAFGWKMASRGQTSLVVVDELYDALSSSMHFRAGGNSAISEIARKGRSRGVSLATTSQIPQALPQVILDLSDTKAIFKLDSRSLNYIERALRIDWQLTEVILTLRTGEFVLIEQGSDWDGVIYGPRQ